MSIGVGWLVGTAMMKGSNGVGGRRYQIMAALLTYAAVSMAAIPIWIHFAPQHAQQQSTQQQKRMHEQQPEARQTAPQRRMTLGIWLYRLTLLGLASPFVQLSGNPFWGTMGILILFFGIRSAWRLTQGREIGVFGPFIFSPPPVPL